MYCQAQFQLGNFQDFNYQKENHSKVCHIKYTSFEMQKYLKPGNMKITKEKAQEIFKLRSRMSDVKSNYKGKYESLNEKCVMKMRMSRKNTYLTVKV